MQLDVIFCIAGMSGRYGYRVLRFTALFLLPIGPAPPIASGGFQLHPAIAGPAAAAGGGERGLAELPPRRDGRGLVRLVPLRRGLRVDDGRARRVLVQLAGGGSLVEPAPGRFSTTAGWPSCSCSFEAIARPTMSEEPPATNGMITRIGFEGKFCAAARPLVITTDDTSAIRRM